MERIKKALEKARETNDGAALKPSTPTKKKQNDILDIQTGVTYSQTRKVSGDKASLMNNRVISELDNPEALTAYKLLRTQVEHRLTATGWNALAVTSPGADQGKTLTAINLAISLAYEVHRTVLLVDLDLRNPSIHKIFGANNGLGITDYLYNDVPLNEILFNPGLERLVVLPGSEPIANSSETLASPKMARLVNELKTRYPSRFVIFDLPPILSADDALAFSPHVDAALLVVEDGVTTKDDLARSVELLKQTELLGTVLNKTSERQTAYYYG